MVKFTKSKKEIEMQMKFWMQKDKLKKQKYSSVKQYIKDCIWTKGRYKLIKESYNEIVKNRVNRFLSSREETDK